MSEIFQQKMIRPHIHIWLSRYFTLSLQPKKRLLHMKQLQHTPKSGVVFIDLDIKLNRCDQIITEIKYKHILTFFIIYNILFGQRIPNIFPIFIWFKKESSVMPLLISGHSHQCAHPKIHR